MRAGKAEEEREMRRQNDRNGRRQSEKQPELQSREQVNERNVRLAHGKERCWQPAYRERAERKTDEQMD